MIAEPPRASRLAVRAPAITSDTRQQHHSDHHPGTRQEPVLFASLYLAQPGSVANARPGSFGDAFFFSLETLATVGYGTMSPDTTYGHIVSAFEIFSGMALTAVLTGLLFVRFSRPKSKVLYSTRALVAMHNGQPTLMLRIGNGRLTLLTDATAKLGVLLSSDTTEGQSFRRLHDLRLLRTEMQVFVLTWTLMHTLDADSPLYGYDTARLVQDDVRLFLSLDARDQSLGARVQDVQTYGPADIVFGQRFADVITREASGHTTADLTRLDSLVLLHRGFDCLGVSRIERGQVGIGYLDSDAPGGAGLA